jgi:hypothetical protein
MSTPNAQTEQRTRTWLATAFAQCATWRQAKAAEYANDPRNGKSASALFSAASYARDNAKHGAGIFQMTQLVAACDELGYDLMGDGYVFGFTRPTAERIAGRYGFDHEPGLPGDAQHDHLLRELFIASLEDIRDTFDEDDDEALPPHSRLAELFAEHLRSKVVREPSTNELLAEIRDAVVGIRQALEDRHAAV